MRHSLPRTRFQKRKLFLGVELLESRDVPATFTVTTLADAGAGSLRDAIDQANTVNDADTIVFGGAAVGGTIGLSTFINFATGTATVPQPTGPTALLVRSPVTIQGTGETITRMGATTFRLFQVTAAGNLSLRNLTLSKGLAQGGAGGDGINGGGGAAGLGGAIYNQGKLTITGSTLTANQAIGGSGSGSSGSNAGGGGLGGPGSSAVNGNGGLPNVGAGGSSAGGGGFGGGGGGGSINGGGGFGGGGGGGSINGSGGFGGGGGGGSTGGTGGFGGGKNLTGGLGGGGAGLGGAVFNQGGTIVLVNSTLAANTAQGGNTSGGQVGSGFGGGIVNLNGDLTLTNVTAAANTVATGTGGGVNEAGGGAVYNLSLNVGVVTPTQMATANVANSIFASTVGGSDVANNQMDGTATITASGPNIVSVAVTNTGGTVPPFTLTNPKLGALANNGGFTQTMALLTGSPAINAGSNAAVPVGVINDQRGSGFVRIGNTTVDIGAFEVQPPPTKSNLVGFRQFGVGADVGASTAILYNPDKSVQLSITPFPGFTGGVRTAAADFNNDGVADLIVGTGPGIATRVLVLDGKSQAILFDVAPFEASFKGGVYVSAGDVTGDGIPDLAITPDEGGGPRVDIYSGAASFPKLTAFFGIDDTNFRGGARSAIADMTGDGTADLIVVAGFGGGPRVAAFDGKSLATTPVKIFGDFFAFEQALRNGIFVTAGDINGDGFADLIAGGGPGGGPRVLALDGKSLLTNTYVNLANFFGGDVNSRGGIRVAVKNLDGDNRADLVVGSGSGAGSRVTGYLGKNIGPNGTPTTEFDFDAVSGFSGGVFVG